MDNRNVLRQVMKLICLLTTYSLSRADEPLKLGYERWSDNPVDSGTALALKPASIFGVYADQWTLVGRTVPTCNYRLIDIEPADPHGTTFNIIWIKNAGDYKTTSYLVYDLTEDEVHVLAKVKGIFILDIEAYGAWWQPKKFAAIVRSNPHNYDTKILTGVTYDELQTWLGKSNWRPIDIDMRQTDGEIVKMPSKYEESMNLYDAVFTFGPLLYNHVETVVAYGDHQDIQSIQEDFHLIDVENTGDWYQHYFPDRPFLYIFVDQMPSTQHVDFLAFSDDHAIEAGLVSVFFDVESSFNRCVDVESGSIAGVMGIFKE